MSTLKFKTDSPYVLKDNNPCPKEDVTYLNHIKDLKLEKTNANEKFGVAIFGMGRAGTIHLSYISISKRVNLLYIVDDDREKLKKLKSHFNLKDDISLITSKDDHKVYSDPRVRFIICSTPTFSHEKIVYRALKNGKAVFCEKPVAENIESTKAIYEISKSVGQPLFSAFNRRFDPTYSTLINKVKNGDIGQILIVKVCSRDSPLPSIEYLKTSGGIFHDCAVHDIDTILFTIGELPTKISALATATIPEIKEINDFDTVTITMSFPSGAIGIIDLSRQCSYGYDQRLEVFGRNGMLKADNKSPVQTIEEFKNEYIKRAPIDYSFASRYCEAYKIEVDHFIDVLERKSKMLVSSYSVLAVSKIASAAEESARNGKIVEIEWNEDEIQGILL